ncbi:MAG: hypothetical protein SFX72_05950 [Isosphaeraceae bacterium]|nr:hypothetical protein [Isosphaeraceae bacterium]
MHDDEEKQPAGSVTAEEIDRALPSWTTNSRFFEIGVSVLGAAGAIVAVLLIRGWWRPGVLVLGGLAGVVAWFVFHTILMTVLGNLAALRLSRRSGHASDAVVEQDQPKTANH